MNHISYESVPIVSRQGDVWGDPRKPETWRLVRDVDELWFTQWEFGDRTFEPRRLWDAWFRETKPHNITGMVADYLQRE